MLNIVHKLKLLSVKVSLVVFLLNVDEIFLIYYEVRVSQKFSANKNCNFLIRNEFF
jgi:hypothetical protein